jgi:hypothetical protein
LCVILIFLPVLNLFYHLLVPNQIVRNGICITRFVEEVAQYVTGPLEICGKNKAKTEEEGSSNMLADTGTF